MTQETTSVTTEQAAPSAKNPMAEMCEQIMVQWASSFSRKGSGSSSCCSGLDTTSTETKRSEDAAEGTESK